MTDTRSTSREVFDAMALMALEEQAMMVERAEQWKKRDDLLAALQLVEAACQRLAPWHDEHRDSWQMADDLREHLLVAIEVSDDQS